MNSPILVWMLYLNREVTAEVRTNPLFPLRHNFFPPSPFPIFPFPRPELPYY